MIRDCRVKKDENCVNSKDNFYPTEFLKCIKCKWYYSPGKGRDCMKNNFKKKVDNLK